MKQTLVALALTATVSSAVAQALPTPDYVAPALDPAIVQPAIKKAVRAITEELLDPDSAKFRCIRVKRNEEMDVITVSGGVNAKNAYGGYVGYKAFNITMHMDLTVRNGGIMSMSDSIVCDE